MLRYACRREKEQRERESCDSGTGKELEYLPPGMINYRGRLILAITHPYYDDSGRQLIDGWR